MDWGGCFCHVCDDHGHANYYHNDIKCVLYINRITESPTLIAARRLDKVIWMDLSQPHSYFHKALTFILLISTRATQGNRMVCAIIILK